MLQKEYHAPWDFLINDGEWEVFDAYGHTVACNLTEAHARLIAAAPKLLDSHEPERGGADFLDWVADRLVNVYGESEDVDFVICLRRRAAKAREAISQAIGV